mgnify:CR=1 FL=1
MFSKKANKPQSRIDSLIGAGATIEGNITFTGGLRIDGQVKGNVRSDEDAATTLVVSEKACIEGEIQVANMVINGTVLGSIHAAEFLELQPNARVTGDISYNTLEMHLGAVVQGRLVHQGSVTKPGLKLATSN